MADCPECGGYMHRQSKTCRACYEGARSGLYVERDCQWCGEGFTVHQSQVNAGGGKYCSRSCARSGSPTRPRRRAIVECHTCGADIERHLSEIRRSTLSENFCSPACWYTYAQRENHPQWNGGQDERVNPDYYRWRRAVIQRDCGFCRICRDTQNLEVHHIERFSSSPERRWDVDNGITLCRSCHVKTFGQEDEHIEILSFIASVPVEVWA